MATKIKPHGKVIQTSSRQIFPEGIEKFIVNDIEFKGQKTPMESPWIYVIEWIDTEAKKDEKEYSLKYAQKEGNIYKDVVITTKGFTLKAPEVEIEESENEVRFYILCKVAK